LRDAEDVLKISIANEKFTCITGPAAARTSMPSSACGRRGDGGVAHHIRDRLGSLRVNGAKLSARWKDPAFGEQLHSDSPHAIPARTCLALLLSKEVFVDCVCGVTDARAVSAYHSSHDDVLNKTNNQTDGP